MIKKSGNKILDGLDFFLNKLLPKKYIIMSVVCVMTYLLPTKIPAEFYYLVGIYIGGSTVVSSIKKKGGGDGT